MNCIISSFIAIFVWRIVNMKAFRSRVSSLNIVNESRVLIVINVGFKIQIPFTQTQQDGEDKASEVNTTKRANIREQFKSSFNFTF